MANPTVLLSTFNSTLAFTDASGTGAWTDVAPIQYAALGPQNGLWLQSGLVNLCTNGSFESDTTGWANQSSPTSVGVSATHASHGTQSMRVVVTTAAFTGVQFTTAVTAANHTFAFDIWGAADDEVRITFFGSGVADGSVSETFVLATTGLSRLRLDGPIGGTGDCGFYIDTGANAQTVDWYIDSVMIISGDVAADVYFAGTSAPNVSVDQDGTDRIDPASGAIAFRYKRLIDTGGEEIILTCGTVGSGTDYLEIGIDATDHLYMEWDSDNGGAQRVTSTGTISVDTEYFLYCEWDGTAIGLSIDNGTIETDTRDAVEGSWGAGDLELSAATGSVVVGPFAVYERELTAKEIARLNARDTWGFNTLRSGNRHNIFQLRPRAA